MKTLLRAVIVVWFCLVASQASANVSFDVAASSGFSGSVTSFTLNITIGNNTNRAVQVDLAFLANTISGVSVTLGGVTGVLVSGSDTGTTATGARTMIFCVTAPPTGAQTVSVSWTTATNVDIGAISAFNVNQATPCTNGTFTAGNSGVAAQSLSVTSANGDLTHTVGHTSGSWVTPNPSNQTKEWGIDSSAAAGDIGPGIGTTTHTWTDQFGAENWAISGANFKAVAGGASTGTGNKQRKLKLLEGLERGHLW